MFHILPYFLGVHQELTESNVRLHQNVVLVIHVCTVVDVKILDLDWIARVQVITMESVANMSLMLVKLTHVKMERHVLITGRGTSASVHQDLWAKIVMKI